MQIIRTACAPVAGLTLPGAACAAPAPAGAQTAGCVRPPRRVRGFTLIEVMIVVVIVGILASIAYPSYVEHIRRTRRTDATQALMEAAAVMERYFSQNQSYVGATLGSGANDVYPATSSGGFYTLAFSVGPTANAYTLTAMPVAGASQANDECGNFTLNNLSARGISGNGVTVRDCWRM